MYQTYILTLKTNKTYVHIHIFSGSTCFVNVAFPRGLSLFIFRHIEKLSGLGKTKKVNGSTSKSLIMFDVQKPLSLRSGSSTRAKYNMMNTIINSIMKLPLLCHSLPGETDLFYGDETTEKKLINFHKDIQNTRQLHRHESKDFGFMLNYRGLK